MTTPRARFLAAPLIALALALAAGATACGSDSTDTVSTASAAGSATVTDAWIRQPAEGQTNAVAYATITNSGDSEIRLVGAAVPLSATIELHETTMDDDGVMSMQERSSGFAIAAGETLTLEPGGPHVMMVGVEPTDLGADLSVVFLFEGAESVTATADVRAISGADDAAGDMGEMDDGEMDGG